MPWKLGTNRVRHRWTPGSIATRPTARSRGPGKSPVRCGRCSSSARPGTARRGSAISSAFSGVHAMSSQNAFESPGGPRPALHPPGMRRPRRRQDSLRTKPRCPGRGHRQRPGPWLSLEVGALTQWVSRHSSRGEGKQRRACPDGCQSARRRRRVRNTPGTELAGRGEHPGAAAAGRGRCRAARRAHGARCSPLHPAGRSCGCSTNHRIAQGNWAAYPDRRAPLSILPTGFFGMASSTTSSVGRL